MHLFSSVCIYSCVWNPICHFKMILTAISSNITMQFSSSNNKIKKHVEGPGLLLSAIRKIGAWSKAILLLKITISSSSKIGGSFLCQRLLQRVHKANSTSRIWIAPLQWINTAIVHTISLWHFLAVSQRAVLYYTKLTVKFVFVWAIVRTETLLSIWLCTSYSISKIMGSNEVSCPRCKYLGSKVLNFCTEQTFVKTCFSLNNRRSTI